MLYFKNVELAEAQHVSLRTVLNWIKAAQEGKLDLTLHEHGGKTYIANTSRNVATIERLVAERKKFRNSRGHKVITPRPEFYRLYNKHQILDIISNLEIYHEIPLKYAYFGDGAYGWDEYVERSAEDSSPNMFNNTHELLNDSLPYLGRILRSYKQVNVVDIGVGNGLPIKDLISWLRDENKLGRYVALDLSAAMIRIAHNNITKWFGDTVVFESHEVDIEYDRFNSFFAQDYMRKDCDEMANLVVFFGGTDSNLRNSLNPFRMILDSMGKHDLLLTNKKLDTKASRNFFDFNPNESGILNPAHRFVPELLGIDSSLYDVETGFDERQKMRYIKIRFRMALTIQFEFQDGERLLSFNKYDAILIFRSWHQNAKDVLSKLDKNGFTTLHASQTEDEGCFLTISRVKGDQGTVAA